MPLHSSAHEAIRQTSVQVPDALLLMLICLPYMLMLICLPYMTSVQVTAKLARNSQNRARIIYNGGHEALVYHANFSPDARTREVAQPAADELLYIICMCYR